MPLFGAMGIAMFQISMCGFQIFVGFGFGFEKKSVFGFGFGFGFQYNFFPENYNVKF